jgi:DNA-binding MarR family transcriptional regulator
MSDYQGGFLISQIKQTSGRVFNQLLAEKNIDAFNGEQGRILYVLWQEDNIAIRDLSSRTGLAVTTLTSMLDRMERSNLVCRADDPDDRRKKLIQLTENAKKLQTEYEAVSSQMEQIFYNKFNDSEIQQCEIYLRRILENVQNPVF